MEKIKIKYRVGQKNIYPNDKSSYIQWERMVKGYMKGTDYIGYGERYNGSGLIVYNI